MKSKKTKEDILVTLGEKFHSKLINILDKAKAGKATANPYLSVADFADLVKYSSFVYSGQFRKAQIMQANFDTSVYEYIPNTLWEKIEYGDFKK